MRRLRRSIGIGAALTLLAVGAPLVGTASAAHVACGTTITANTTLHSNIGPCSGDGIIIGANNITLNLNGHEIFGTPGDGGGNQAGIRVPFKSGVSIVGKSQRGQSAGTVRGFDAGVFVNGGSANTVRNLVVRDNIGPLDSNSLLGDGIVVFKSPDNQIVDNVVRNNGRFDGIGVLGLGANNNTIRGNIVEGNVGISEAESPPVGPGFIPHYINAPGHGIIVNHFLDQPVETNGVIYGNKVMDNIIRRNNAAGISNVSNHDGVIAGNIVEDNALQLYRDLDRWFGNFLPPGDGIGLTAGLGEPFNAPQNVLVRDNITNHNGLGGIFTQGVGNRIVNNQAFHNGAIGIDISSHDNIIQFNDTGYNWLFYDLYDNSNVVGAGPCTTNRWWGNTWGPVMPPGLEYGDVTPNYPDCVMAGPKGLQKAPPAELSAIRRASGQMQPGGRGFSGK